MKLKSTQQRLILKQQISENHEMEKQLFYRRRNQTLVSMERNKKQMDEDFSRQISDNNLTPKNINKIAKKYNVDMNNIYRKINNSNNRAVSQMSNRNVKITRVTSSTK